MRIAPAAVAPLIGVAVVASKADAPRFLVERSNAAGTAGRTPST